MKTTLNKIREHLPGANVLAKLLKHLNKTQADDEPLTILTVLDSNGLDDALRCFLAVDGYEKEMRLYEVWCARRVQHLMPRQKAIAALDVAERHALGEATDEELKSARDEAKYEAMDAAQYTALDAAQYTALDAAQYTALAAAQYAASDSAQHAALATASCAEQAAAWSVIWDPAQAEACATTWYAARDAARAAQETELRRVLNEIEAAHTASHQAGRGHPHPAA